MKQSRIKPRIDANEPKHPIKDAAPRLDLHPQTVKLKCESGEIRATKPGRRWLIPESSIEEYLTRSGVAVAA